MSIKLKLALMLGAPILVCVGGFLLVNALSPQSSSFHVPSSSSFTNEWARTDFTAISDGPDFRASLAKIKAGGDYRLSDGERRELNYLLLNFLLYHHTNRFDYYEAFRFGAPEGQFVKTVVDFDKSRLQKMGLAPLDSPNDVLKMFWDHIEIPERERTKGDWVEIGLSDAIITAEVRPEWPLPLGEFAARRANDSVLTHFSYYLPRPAPQDLLKQNGEIKIATFYAIVRQANHTPAPVYLRSYFEPATKKWIPWEFVTAGTDAFFNSVY